MSTNVKEVILQKKIEGVLYDLMVQTNSENVMMSDGRTLAAVLSEYLTATEVTTKIDQRFNAIVNGAPAAFDTLKEISDYISQHEDVYDALNAAVGNKVDKVSGKGLSTQDFTTALKTKLEGLSNYTHPSTHGADMITETSSKRFVSDTEKTAWNAKLDAGSYTAADVLSKIKGVDGTGSGLDADLLDGKEASAFALIGDLANYLSKTGGTMTGDIILKGDPTNVLHPATKQYVDGLMQGLNLKASCKVATTGNITLSGTQTIDGVAVAAGDRVLVKNQTTGSQNGVYAVNSGAWTRAEDANTTAELKAMFTFVEQGTTNADSGWVMITDNITLGTTALAYTQFSGAGAVTVGTGLTKTGNQISIANTVAAGTGIKVTYNAQGQITGVASLASGDIPNLDMSKITTGSLAANRITQDANNRFVTDAERTKIEASGRIFVGTSAPADLTENDLFFQTVAKS